MKTTDTKDKKTTLTQKVLMAGAGVAAIAGAIAAAVALSDEKNRKKVKKLSSKLKAKSEDVISELKKLAEKGLSTPEKK